MTASAVPTVYFDANVVSKLGRDRPDLLEVFEELLTRRVLGVVPSSDAQIAECLRTEDKHQRLSDLERLHRWTNGTCLGSHNEVLASYSEARLTGTKTAASKCSTWDVPDIEHNRAEILRRQEEWTNQDWAWANETVDTLQVRGEIGGHTGDAIREATEICVSVAKSLPRRPDKVREFLTHALQGDPLSDSDAKRLGADSWIQLTYAMRLYPSVHACFAKVEGIRETRYRGDVGDWLHAVYARTASHVVTDDASFTKRWRAIATSVGERFAVLAWPDEFATWLESLGSAPRSDRADHLRLAAQVVRAHDERATRSSTRNFRRRREPSRRQRRAWHVVTAVAVFGLTLGVALELNSFFETAIAGLVWLLTAFVGGACFVWGAAKNQRHLLVRGAVICVALVVGTVVGNRIGAAQVLASKERGNRIAAGLSAFHAAEGTYPATLEDLVPDYLSKIPPTAMGLFRTQSFIYEKGDGSYDLRFNGLVGTGFFRGPDAPWTWFD